MTARTWAIVAGLVASGAAFADAPAPATAPFPPAIARPGEATFPGSIALEVDARDVARGIISFRETIPARPGPLTLLYPQWLPGNHAPRGPIDKLAGIQITAGGKAVPWKRDPVNVYAFHVEAPEGASTIEVSAQFLSPTASAQGRVVATSEMVNLQWNALVLYPAGYAAAKIPVRLSLRLPEGWSYASALAPQSGAATAAPVTFAETDLETLVDSPMFAGKTFQRFDLDPGGKVPVHLNVVADEPSLLKPTEAQLAPHRRLVDEAYALFGAQHYDRYDFLLALSERMGRIGLEHHRSSENNPGPKYFKDQDAYVGDWDLLSHEFVHSWNGKFRRPADLYTSNYDVPMRDSLLWVYEGQTQFWGEVLAARAGLWTKPQALDSMAYNTALYALRPGRTWRPLVDTTNDPIISSRAPQPWRSWQRSEDYYTEGLLVWLAADARIREKTNNKRSMDDFAKAFFGVEPGRVTPLTYTREDVIATLNSVVADDWGAFIDARLDAAAAPSPTEGVEASGWRLVFNDEPNVLIKAGEKRNKTGFFLFSLGFIVGDGAKLSEVMWDSPAFNQGLVVGDQIMAVDGRAYDTEKLQEAMKAAKASGAPITLLIKNEDRFRTVAITWTQGLRYPHLERIAGAPDRLSALLAPKVR